MTGHLLLLRRVGLFCIGEGCLRLAGFDGCVRVYVCISTGVWEQESCEGRSLDASILDADGYDYPFLDIHFVMLYGLSKARLYLILQFSSSLCLTLHSLLPLLSFPSFLDSFSERLCQSPSADPTS